MQHSSPFLKSLLLGLCCLLFFQVNLVGQCDLTVDAGPDQIECFIPATFQLNGSVNSSQAILSTEWTPSTGLSDPFSLNPTTTVNGPMTYTLTASSFDPNENLVVNGDFSAGNTGFTSDYTHNATPFFPGNELDEGQYSIGTDPSPMHINWVACGDHTTGNGEMMLVNGHETANQNVWCQTINVLPNTNYVFSAWVTSVDPNGPCLIQFNINNTPLGAGNLALTTTCLWQNIFEVWNSGANTSATVCIEDLNTDEMGNDFAIDDILLAPVCAVFDEVDLSTNEPIVSADNNGPICEGETIILTASGGVTYDWIGPSGALYFGDFIEITNASLIDEGIYDLLVTDADGCTASTSTEVLIAPTHEIFLEETTCDPALAGIDIQNLINQYGCDSMVQTMTTLNPRDSIQLNETTCDTSEVGIYIQELTNRFECDSIVETTITLNPSYAIALFETTCDSSLAGIFTQELSTIMGCDSMITTTIQLSPSDTIFVQETSCDSSLVDVFTQDLINQYGCDSTVTTSVEYQAPQFTLLEEVSCDSLSSGTFIQNLSNQYGCDSTVTTIVLFVPSYHLQLTQTTCDSSLAGVFTQELNSQFGCDSIVETTITLDPSHITNLQETTCDSILAGIFTQSLFNQYGCDSTVNTEVIYEESYDIEVFLFTCDTALVGVSTQSFITQSGCDSLVTSNFSLHPISQCALEISFEGSEIPCTEKSGSLAFTALLGEAPYEYQISGPINSNGILSATNTPLFINDLPPGTYTITVMSANGLTTINQTEITLYNPPKMSAQIDSDYNGYSISCAGSNDGSASIFIEGGVPPYQTLWSTGDTTQVLDQLTAGLYSISVVDANGCIDSIEIFLNEADSLSSMFTINGLSCFEQDIGEIIVNAIGGTPPYTYSLNGAPPQSSDNFNGLMAGTYNIASIDNNGCETQELISINSLLPVSVDLGDNLNIESGSDTTIEALINVPYDSLISVVWLSNESFECMNCLTQMVAPIITSSYGIIITDSYGCTDEDEISINVTKTRKIYIPNVFSPNGDGVNDLFLIFSDNNTIEEIKSFKVYSRWGELIFKQNNVQPNDENFAWDGRYSGEPLNSGVYVWSAEIKYTDGEVEQRIGDITILK